MIVLFAHVRTGQWASVMPSKLAETLGLTDTIRAIPITEPEAVHTIGLVVPEREPMTPLSAALVTEARRLAKTLDPALMDASEGYAMLLVPTRLAQSRNSRLRRFRRRADRAGDTGVALRQRPRHGVQPGHRREFLPEHVQAFFSHYGYLDRSVKRIILCFDDARFVNHSDAPNVATDYAQDPYGLDVALRDIAAGEELTMDYAGIRGAERRKKVVAASEVEVAAPSPLVGEGER